MTKVYVYHKDKNEIVRFQADYYDSQRNAFVMGAPRGYDPEYCYIYEGDQWSEDLESLMDNIDSLSEEQKDQYREEWL